MKLNCLFPKGMFLTALFPTILPMTTLQAGALDDADALFAQRGAALQSHDRNAIRMTRQAYENLLPQLSGKDLLDAMGKIGRLYVFEGDYMISKDSPEDRNERHALFSECMVAVEQISPDKVGVSDEYFYTKATCTALAAEVGSLAEKIRSAKLFKGDTNLLEQAISHGRAAFLGGGIYRTAAGVLSNPLASVVGLFKPEEAIAHTDAALASDAYGDSELFGEDYCDNYRFKIQAILAKTRGNTQAEAKAVLDQAMSYFDISFQPDGTAQVGYLPAHYEPETQVCADRLFSYYKELP